MSGLVTSGEKSLVLVSGRAHLELAEEVGKEIGCGLSQVTAYDLRAAKSTSASMNPFVAQTSLSFSHTRAISTSG